MRAPALILATVLALTAASPTMADEDARPAGADQSVKVSPVALPIVANGHLVNYVFVTVKVLLNPGVNALALSDREPYFRDALVRAAHRTPFVIANDYNHIDEAKLKAALYRDAVQIAGPGAVRGVEVLSQQAQHRVASPH
jgi:hypothetical protein